MKSDNGGVSLSRTAALWICGLLLSFSLLGLTTASASAGTAEEIAALPVLDSLNRTEEVFSNGGKWSALAWDSSTTGHNTGRDTTAGWGPYDAFPVVNGAYWNSSSLSDKTGNAAAVTMPISPGGAERYVALWLDMPSPGSAKTGYQLRWTVVSGTTYSVTLSKYSAGSQTVLSSNSAVTIPAGATLAISDTGGTVTAWQGSGGSLTSILTTADSTFSSGYAGFDGSGNISRSTNFKAGNLSGGGGVPPDTTISSGPKGVVVPNLTFGFTSTEGGSVFECSLDGGAYGACVSPKAYQGVAEGSRIFRVRAVGAGGKDETPAERGFQVVQAAKATAKTALLDNLERSEVPLAGGKWSKSSWAGEIGGAWMGSYRGYGAGSGLAGAYWNPTSFSDGEGTVLASGAVGTGSVPAGQYSALLLNMPNPAGVRSGYEARFTGTGSATSYTVELARWVSGTRTVLASTTGFSLPVGTTIALTETAGGSVALWTGTTTLSAVLSANDSTYTSGYAGLEVSGGAGTIYNFRAGRIDIQAPDTTITSGPTGTVLPAAVSFAFSSTEGGSSFECSLDGAAYSACTSPKAYPTIGGGPHAFRVRSVDAVGNQDLTSAERSFQVVQPPTAATLPATEVGASGATLKATVNPNGGETTYQLEYGTTTAYGAKAPVSAKAVGSGISAVTVAETVSGFIQGTTYHYRVLAKNEAGTTYGADQAFETPFLPDATTETASAVDADEAILNGTVDPNGSDTTYRFEYGTTTSYGSTVPEATEEVETGSKAEEAEEAVAFLQPNTTYHYRLRATSGAGTVVGTDKTLTTAASTVSAQQAAEERQEEIAFTGKFTGPLPADFVNLQWTGNHLLDAEEPEMEAIRRSGAKVLRLGIQGSTTFATYDEIFKRAATRGITILPQFQGGKLPAAAGWEETINTGAMSLREFVRRYGHEGIFWKTSGLEKSKWREPTYWEIWNEPNIATNGPIGGGVNPSEFGEFLAKAAAAVRNADGSAKILLGGLLSVNKKPGQEIHKTPAEFLKQMDHQEAYDAVAIHPYAFKVKYANGQEGPPVSHGQVEKLTEEKVRGNIQEARDALDGLEGAAGNGKELWINELGWPVENPIVDPSHPAVSYQIQSELLHASFQMIKAKSKDWKIRNVFYYNIKDWAHGDEGHMRWDFRSGLRTDTGGYRPAWYAFQEEAGVPISWPAKPVATTKNAIPYARQAIGVGTINPGGVPTSYRFQWGATTAYGNSTPWQSAGFEEGAVDKTGEIPNLTPESDYHYRVVAINENGEEAKGEDKTFHTYPSTETSATVVTYNGEPGWAEVHGWVKEGGEGPGVQNGPEMFVNVVFEKKNGSGDFEIITDKTRHPVIINGQYGIDPTELSLSNGTWKSVTYFPGSGVYGKSHSGEHEFKIKNGYKLIAKHSNKCLDVYNGSLSNGAPMIQYQCGDPQAALNQVFKLVPQGGAYFQLVARHSNRCVDVTAGSQTQGVQLSQYDCMGPGQTNQIWESVGVEKNGLDNSFNRFIAKHSGQCMEVQASSQANGGIVDQYGCFSNQANQLWTFESVEANPVPATANLTIDEALHGEPGYVTFHGSIDTNGGAYPLAGTKAYVHFERKDGSGQYQEVPGETREVTIDANAKFAFSYWGIGGGDWQAKVVFPGAGPLQQDDSEYRPFHIGSGYRFEFRHSANKCLTTSENGKTSGTQLIQWTCAANASSGDGQVFSVVPSSPGYFQMRPNSVPAHNMCVDVYGADPANNALLKLYQCIPGAANQEWQIIPISGQPGWFASIAKHSGKCMDVTGNNPSNGALIEQWTCVWSGNQQWRWHEIG